VSYLLILWTTTQFCYTHPHVLSLCTLAAMLQQCPARLQLCQEAQPQLCAHLWDSLHLSRGHCEACIACAYLSWMCCTLCPKRLAVCHPANGFQLLTSCMICDQLTRQKASWQLLEFTSCSGLTSCVLEQVCSLWWPAECGVVDGEATAEYQYGLMAGQFGYLLASLKGKHQEIDRSTCACQEMCQLKYCHEWTKVCCTSGGHRQQHAACCFNHTEHAGDDFAICSCRA